MKLQNKTQKIILTSLMASIVLLSTLIKIVIPLPSGNTMIHLGNIACIVSGLLLGSIYGGLAAGIGSFLFDLLDPIFIASAPITFVLKFLMAFICGTVKKSLNIENPIIKNGISAIVGSICFLVLYLIKTFIINAAVLKVSLAANLILIAKSGLISLINVIIAVVVSVPIVNTLEKRKDLFI